MLTEIEHAAGWWASQLSRTSPKETQAFKQALIVELSSRYVGHWFWDDAQRGCAYRCISYDHRMDSSLVRAAQTVGLDANIDTLLVKARWHSMFVNPGLVKVQNTKHIVTSPIIVYDATATTTTPTQQQQLTLPGFNPRRSSMNDVAVTDPLSALMMVLHPPMATATATPTPSSSVDVSSSPIELPAVTVNGLAPSLMPHASVAPKKSALKGQHHRSKSTSPVSAPLSVRFNPSLPQAATYVSSSPSQDVIKPASPPTTTLAPPMAKPASPTFQLAKPASPPAPSMGSSMSLHVSPKAVHHSSHSVDLNSALFADLTLNVKPSARTVTPPSITLTVTPPAGTASASALAPATAPVPVAAPAPARAQLEDRAAPLPTIFNHMSRAHNRPTHHVSQSCSFPYNWNLDFNNMMNLQNTSPTHCPSPSTLSPKSPTSLSLPRMVSHHRGLSASLLPSALLVV